MILVYASYSSNRLKYILRFIFEDVMGVPWRLTTKLDEVEAFDGQVINYSKNAEAPGVQMIPHGLIRQKGVKEIAVKQGEWEGLATIFPTKGEVPFDLFSASFYLISRYEEYQPHRSDHYGRFLAEESLAYQSGFLSQPLIDQWVKQLAAHLKMDLSATKKKYRFFSTIDVDSAFAYQHKGLMRTLGGMAKDITSGEFSNLGERMKSVLGGKEDPFDTYDKLHELHEKYGVKAIYFFLLADYGLNDKGVSFKSKPLQQLIRRLGDYYAIGIHPGFQSNSDPMRLKQEVERLALISRKNVELSRQHFLILNFPETYRRLIDQGIKEDHTMGYASQPGFRASTCTPFSWYDLERELETKLVVHPFAVMDATLSRYLMLTPDQGEERIAALAKTVREVNGQMIILWHNESISEKWGWKGWSKVYQKALSDCAE